MRGDDTQQVEMFSYVMPEQRVPADHPLRPIKVMINAILKEMSGDFEKLYAREGRPSVPPEQLLRALLLQAFYSVRSERQLMEELKYNILFRWFVGLNMDEEVWVPTTFSKNRERLLNLEVAQAFFEGVVELARDKGLVSEEHFTVDGTLIEAWASHKSFKPKAEGPSEPAEGDEPGQRNTDVDFKGQTRSNETHASTTDPQARLCRKGPGKEAKLCYNAHLLMENRTGLAVGGKVTQVSGTAEREAALDLLEKLPGDQQLTVGADKGYDTADFVSTLQAMAITPHVASKARYSAVDGALQGEPGYAISQCIRKRIEEIFGWLKTVAELRKTRHRGVERVGSVFMLALAGYNLVRLRNLMSAT